MMIARLAALLIFYCSLCGTIVKAEDIAEHSVEYLFHFCGEHCPSMNETHLTRSDVTFLINYINANSSSPSSPSYTHCFDVDDVMDGKSVVDQSDVANKGVALLLSSIGATDNCTFTSDSHAFVSALSQTTNDIEGGAFGAYDMLALEAVKHIDHDHDEEEEDHDEEYHDDHDDADEDHDHDHAEFLCAPVDEIIANTSLLSADEQANAIALFVLSMQLFGDCNLPHRVNTTQFATALFDEFQTVNGMLTEDGLVGIYEVLGLDSGHAADGVVHTHRRSVSSIVSCYHPDELASAFGYNLPLTREEFEDVCVALVYMIESGDCVETAAATAASAIGQDERWGYSFLAAIVSSAVSFSGAVILVCFSKKKYTLDSEVADSYHNTVHKLNNHLLIVLMSLSIGTLLGDAFLHLVPHAIGAHDHDAADAHGHSAEEGDPFSFLWKMLVALGGFYMFFVVEISLAKFTGGVTHEHHHGRHHNNSPHHDHEMCHLELEEMTSVIQSHPETIDELKKEHKEHEKEHHKHDGESAHHIARSSALLVLYGDAIHNFVDGLAIAASFSTSVIVGVSTTVAIICHEVPHEIGDFAILLDSGMTVKKALTYNFISSLTCFAGVVIGLAATNSDNSEPWFLALAAGLFVYIAVSDITPHVLQHVVTAKSFKKAFSLMNIGFLTGVAAMLLLARFEEDISF
eukprot:m.221988 g.221988  ORF g.221988 m.221988 type:complete len:688 (+) comp13848_c0_seq6:3149-5212(+)